MECRTDVSYSLGDCNLGEGSATVKDVISDALYTAGDDHALQRCASIKCLAVNFADSFRESDIAKRSATDKDLGADDCLAVGKNGDFAKRCAVAECVFSNVSANSSDGERCTTLKGFFSDFGYVLRNADALKGGTVFESVFSNRC